MNIIKITPIIMELIPEEVNIYLVKINKIYPYKKYRNNILNP